MLAPIRDYLGPQDPQSSPLLCETRDRYFSRLSVSVTPGKPGFEEARWIVLEDVNVEHLLDVFISIDQNAGDVRDVCVYFMNHLYWHKPRQTVLGSKIEALADDHHSKPMCLTELSDLLGRVGNHSGQNRLLAHALELERRWGDDDSIAYTLQQLSDVNRLLNLSKEGIGQAKEALEIYERTGGEKEKASCLELLASLLFCDQQLDAAEDTACRAIDLVTEGGDQFIVCSLHTVLGKIYGSKGEKKKAIHHFETAIKIASSFDRSGGLFWAHFYLAELFCDESEFDDATAHIEQAKPYAINEPYKLGRAIHLQAIVWRLQLKLEAAKSEALHALEIFERLGAAQDTEILQTVEQEMRNQSISSQAP